MERCSGIVLFHKNITSAFQTSRKQLVCSSLQVKRFHSLGENWFPKRLVYTKYRISKPASNDTAHDDIFLSSPKRSDFAKTTKNIEGFLRFLRLVCDQENRQSFFKTFANKHQNGLLVEDAAYVTFDELMKCIWKNGFSNAEMNAFSIAFDVNYKFHYPELAALFDIPEEDAYKFCLRQRAAEPEDLVELKYRKPTNLLSSYGLLFLAAWNGLSNQVLSNAWFYSKTFPFGAIFFMLGSYFSKDISGYMKKHELESAERSLMQKKNEEDVIYKQMQKYANDSKCRDLVALFKNGVQMQMSQYFSALMQRQRDLMTEKILQKLNSIRMAEQAIRQSVQQSVVEEVLKGFQEAYNHDSKLEELAFDAALKNISMVDNPDATFLDPVGDFFVNTLREINSKTGNSVIGTRIDYLFQKKEKDFLNSFAVRSFEAQEIKNIGTKCRSTDGKFDFSMLKETEFQKLESLFKDINNRVGFHFIDEQLFSPINEGQFDCTFTKNVNEQLIATQNSLRHERLSAFVQAFA